MIAFDPVVGMFPVNVRDMVKLRVVPVVYLVDHLATGWRLERFFRAQKHPPATNIANSSRFTQQTQ